MNSHVLCQVIENNGQSLGSSSSGLPNGPLEEEGLCRGTPALLLQHVGQLQRGLTLTAFYVLTPNKRLLSGSRLKEGVLSQSTLVMHFTRSPLNPYRCVRGAQASCLLDSQTLLNFGPTGESPGNLSADSDVRDLGEGLRCLWAPSLHSQPLRCSEEKNFFPMFLKLWFWLWARMPVPIKKKSTSGKHLRYIRSGLILEVLYIQWGLVRR